MIYYNNIEYNNITIQKKLRKFFSLYRKKLIISYIGFSLKK